MEVTGEFEQDYDDLGVLLPEGVRALKIYTTYGASRVPDEKLPALFQKAAELGLIMLAHCEDDELVTSLKRNS
jgi:dihydroorotase-like cyclic amidohydrolase